MPRPLIYTSIKDLRPDLFGPDGPLHRGVNPVLSLPVELSPQDVLYWVGSSSLASIDAKTCKQLVTACCDLGGGILDQYPFSRASASCNHASLTGEFSSSTPGVIDTISPLGVVLLTKNPRALEILLNEAQKRFPGDVTAQSCASLRPRAKQASPQHAFDAWQLCGYFGISSSMEYLTESLGAQRAAALGADRAFSCVFQYRLHPSPDGQFDPLSPANEKAGLEFAKLALRMGNGGPYGSMDQAQMAIETAISFSGDKWDRVLGLALKNHEFPKWFLNTMLVKAIKVDSLGYVGALLDAGASPNARLADGAGGLTTPLLVATESDAQAPILELLGAVNNRLAALQALSDLQAGNHFNLSSPADLDSPGKSLSRSIRIR